MKFLIIIILVIGDVFVINCQNFMKTFSFTDTVDERGVSIIHKDDSYYCSIGTFYRGNQCALYAKFNNKFELVWSKLVPWMDRGNFNDLLVLGDTLVCSGFDAWSENTRKFHLLLLNTDNGDSISHFSKDYTNKIKRNFACNGIVKFKNDLVMYGEGIMEDDTVSGIIQFVDLKGIFKTFREYRYPRNYLNSIFDLHSLNNHMAFISYRDNRPFETGGYRLITKIDSTGEIIDRFLGPKYARTNVNIQNNFTITHSKNYAYMNVSSEYNFEPKLVCSDTLGKIIWEYNFKVDPSKEEILIYDLIPAQFGGILGCGISNSTVKTYDSAIIFKISENGTLDFLKKYNIINSLNNAIESTNLFNLIELDDGSITAIGDVRYSNGILDDVFIINVNSMGCLNQNTCDESNLQLITSSENFDSFPFSSEITVYPNPTNGHINLSFPIEGNYQYVISDLNGDIITVGEVNSESNSDISLAAYSSGIYHIKLTKKNSTLVLKANIIKL